MAVPSPVGDVKIVSPVSTFFLNLKIFKHSNLRSRITDAGRNRICPVAKQFRRMISCRAKKTPHCEKCRGGYQSLFPCLGEGTHVITLRLVLRYPLSKYREQKRRVRLNLSAPTRKVARGWKNKNKYKNQEIFSLPPRLSQFYRVEILACTGVFHIPLLIPEEKEGLLVVYSILVKSNLWSIINATF